MKIEISTDLGIASKWVELKAEPRHKIPVDAV